MILNLVNEYALFFIKAARDLRRAGSFPNTLAEETG